MSTFALALGQWLLAKDSRLEGISRGFRPTSQLGAADVVLGLTVLAGIVLLLLVLSNLSDWIERRGAADSSLALFLSLAKAHKLKWSDQWLLWRVARSQRLAEPAMVFLQPERLRRPFLARRFHHLGSRLNALGERIFAGFDAECGDSTPSTAVAQKTAATAAQQTAAPPTVPDAQPPSVPPGAQFPWGGSAALDITSWLDAHASDASDASPQDQ